jgi:hypothetical protein
MACSEETSHGSVSLRPLMKTSPPASEIDYHGNPMTLCTRYFAAVLAREGGGEPFPILRAIQIHG